MVRRAKPAEPKTNQDAATVLNRSLAEVIDAYYQQIRSSHLDPLAQLRQSKYIGCFKCEPDLAANSEENFKEINLILIIKMLLPIYFYNT